MTALTILIPAAGASSRMLGRDKLLEPVAGHPLLRRQARIALATGVPVVVTLRPEDEARRRALEGLNLTILAVPDAASGLSASLRITANKVATALMVLPGDMPDLTTADLNRLITAFALNPGTCHRGASAGEPGHPVILPACLLPAVAQLSGDTGARNLLAGESVILIDLPARHALTDLDTPEDWARWRGTGLEPTNG